MREARLALEWYLPAATGVPAPDDLAAEYEALAAAALAPVAGAGGRGATATTTPRT